MVYSFCQQQNCADGANPYAALIAVNGMFYGTTFNGGTYNVGTVFLLDAASGVETVLHSFAGGKDGASPVAALIDVNGTLYGTTSEGGTQNAACYTGGCGTVFAAHLATGQETILYAFCQQQNCADGQTPHSNLIYVKGVLYGTTGLGGNNGTPERGGDVGCTGSNCGTVFSLDRNTGAETVLHSFAGGSDGAYPTAGLINVQGTLYSTTGEGGDYKSGTVFSIDPGTRTETALYEFCSQNNCADGSLPNADLVDVHGILYSTTTDGGNTGCYGNGCGTVFSITTSGVENVLYAFQGGDDGAGPESGLIHVNDMLYGTTYAGGQMGFTGLGFSGYGTVFRVQTATDIEKVVYSFQGGGDGTALKPL